MLNALMLRRWSRRIVSLIAQPMLRALTGNEAHLVRDAEHHDVHKLLAAEPLFADFGEVLGERVILIAVLVDFFTHALGSKSCWPSSVRTVGLLVHVQHGGGEIG